MNGNNVHANGKLKLSRLLNQEHSGFAVTFEVLCTMVMMFTFFFFIIFIMMVMNGQRFMNIVLTSTAAEASRWGGTNTRAYTINVGGDPLMTSAQSKLDTYVPEFNARINGSPAVIASNGDKVKVWISYSLPSPWRAIGTVSAPGQQADIYGKLMSSGNLGMEVEVSSIMKAGDLLW